MASPLKPGDVVAERYRIERVLGEGGMGVVLEAEHLILGERVALKVVLPEAAAIPGVVPRFQREARAASRIQSEHVARVMDVGLLPDGVPYLVMEYVEGRDLSAELDARGPLPVEEAISYVLQAAVGVAAAHALGIVHRDLKPSNLFLARLANGRTLVKVLDFGIAKDMADAEAKDLTSTFSALGSAAYMSPEQVRLAKSVDARTDVWAFGVVLFELLTQRMPFDGESITAIAAAITADAPVPLRELRPDVPEGVEAAVLGCLEKNRDLRTPSLAALATALAPFGGRHASVLAARIAETLGVSKPSEKPPPQASPPTPPPASRGSSEATAPGAETRVMTTGPSVERRVILFATVGAGLLGAGALLFTLSGRSGEEPSPAAGSGVGAPSASSTPAATPPVPSVAPRPPREVSSAEPVPTRSTAPPPVAKSRASLPPSDPKTPPSSRGSPAKKAVPRVNKSGKPLVTDL